jgi:hypothetical protein
MTITSNTETGVAQVEMVTAIIDAFRFLVSAITHFLHLSARAANA